MLAADIAALLDAAPVAALVFDCHDRLSFANVAAVALFGDWEHLVGVPIGDLLSPWPCTAENTRPSIREADGGLRPCRVREAAPQDGSGFGRTLFIEPEADEHAAEAAVREANLRLRYVTEMLPQALCIFDAEDRYVLWNQRYADLYPDIAPFLRPGIAFEEILTISLSGGGIREYVEDDDTWLEERMRKFRQPTAREEQQMRDGRWLRHDDQRTPDGGAIGIRVDITELKQREEWLRQLFDANPMPMLLCDSESLSILEANRAAVDFYGYERESLLSRRVIDLQAEEEAPLFAERLHSLEGDCDARTVWRHRTADGRQHHVLVYVRLLKDGAAKQLLLTITDISDQIHAEREATRLANHDALTGLPNRMRFYKMLDDALGGDERDDVVVLCLDLDGFKPVNDTFGHAAGDDVLTMAAERLQAAVEPEIVARLGGDEFAILIKGGPEAAGALAERCIAAFQRPFVIKGLPIGIGVSIGVARSSVFGSKESVLQAADQALYKAKAEGKNTWRIEPEEPLPVRRSGRADDRRIGGASSGRLSSSRR